MKAMLGNEWGYVDFMEKFAELHDAAILALTAEGNQPGLVCSTKTKVIKKIFVTMNLQNKVTGE